LCKTRIYRIRIVIYRAKIYSAVTSVVVVRSRICIFMVITVCTCQIRLKGPFFPQGLSDVVSAYVSAFSSRICLCICHLPQTTGRTLSYLPLYLPSTTDDWQNSLLACPFIIFIEHGSSSLSQTVIVRIHTRTESSFTDGNSPSPE
jgi:hypothetical protein